MPGFSALGARSPAGGAGCSLRSHEHTFCRECDLVHTQALILAIGLPWLQVAATLLGAIKMFEHQDAKVDQKGDPDVGGAGHHRGAPQPSQPGKATTRYMRGFYFLLVALLFCQLYYAAGSQIMTHWTTIEAEWQHLADSQDRTKQSFSQVSPVAGAAESETTSPPTSTELWSRLRRKATVEADSELAKVLLWPVFTAPQLNPDFYKDYEKDQQPEGRVYSIVTYMKLKSELQLALLTLSSFILPFLYGRLGGFAFLLRKLSDPEAKATYAHDARNTLRLHVGALAGLAVGWFINGNSSYSGFGTLSPLTLAFAAGYTSDLLFTALDKVTAAFSSPVSSETSGKTGTTYGGMTVLTGSQRGARGASRSAETGQQTRPSVGSIGEGEASVSSVGQPRPGQRAA